MECPAEVDCSPKNKNPQKSTKTIPPVVGIIGLKEPCRAEVKDYIIRMLVCTRLYADYTKYRILNHLTTLTFLRAKNK